MALASDNVWSPVGQLLGKWVVAIQSLKAGGGSPTEAGYDVGSAWAGQHQEECGAGEMLG